MMTGTRDIRTASMTEGKRPLITPIKDGGTFVNQCKNEYDSRYEMFEIKPTNATGIAQKTIIAVMKPRTANRRITRCHQEMFNDFQTISFGLIPMNLGDTSTS